MSTLWSCFGVKQRGFGPIGPWLPDLLRARNGRSELAVQSVVSVPGPKLTSVAIECMFEYDEAPGLPIGFVIPLGDMKEGACPCPLLFAPKPTEHHAVER